MRFLLEQNADIYAEGSSLGRPLYFILEMLSTLEQAGDQEERLKQAALLFLQHKDYDHQKFFPEEGESLKEYTQSLKLDEKYPEFYQMILGINTPQQSN
mgnify:FL=1